MNPEQLAVTRAWCEESLLNFTRYFFKARYGFKFIVNWHHEAICERLEAVYRGEIQNLIINVPPGSSKTELAVINFSAWTMALNPWCRDLHLSYSDDLAMLNSATTRNLIQSAEYQQLWPRHLANDSKAKSQWNVMLGDKQAGGMYAASTDGQVTGFRAGRMGVPGYNGAIKVDDPLKPKDGESETKRNGVNNQLPQTIRSRRAEPTTPLLVIMQRVHENDPTGYLLGGALGEKFEHLKIPALDSSGKSYWEIKEPTAQLLAFKARQPYIFAGQYQQEPAPEEGAYFLRDWFKPYTILPPHLNYYGASDFAVSDGTGDYTVHMVIGVDPTGELYLVDLWRQQATANVWVDAMLDMAHRWGTLAWAMEGGVIEKAVMPLIRSRMMERQQYPRLATYASTTDKQARSRNIQGRIAARGLHVPSNQPWVADLVTEALNFPNGKNDDQVDVLSLFGTMLTALRPGVIPPAANDNIKTELPTIEQLFRHAQRNRVDR